MTDDEIKSRLDEALWADFVARDQGHKGTLFVHWDRERRRGIRLRITGECREEHANEIRAAVEEAIAILRGRGGDVVIRNDEWSELTVFVESVSLQK